MSRFRDHWVDQPAGFGRAQGRPARVLSAVAMIVVVSLIQAAPSLSANASPAPATSESQGGLSLECSLESGSTAGSVVSCQLAVDRDPDAQTVPIEARVQQDDAAWSTWAPASPGPLQIPAAEVTRIEVRAQGTTDAAWADSETVAMNPDQAAELEASRVAIDEAGGCGDKAATLVVPAGEEVIETTDGSDVVVAESADQLSVQADSDDAVCTGTSGAQVAEASPPMAEGEVTANFAALGATGKGFGYMDEFAAAPGRVDLAADGGSDTVRIYVVGCPGSTLNEAQSAFARAGARDQQIVLTLLWHRNCSDDVLAYPFWDQYAAWQEFVHTAVNVAVYFSGEPVLVEVWNEPNVDTNDAGTVSSFWYSDAYWWAWMGVQQSEQDWGPGYNFPVMTAGMGRPGHSCNRYDSNFNCVETFLNQVRDQLNAWGGLHMVEMTGAHIYPDPTADLTRSQSSDQVGEQFNAVRRPFPSIYTPTFITEVGIRTDGGFYDQAKQCNRLLDIYNGWLPSTATAGMIVFRLIDDPAFQQVNYRYMGTVGPGGDPNTEAKSAFWYLRARNWGWWSGTDCS